LDHEKQGGRLTEDEGTIVKALPPGVGDFLDPFNHPPYVKALRERPATQV